MVLVHELSCIHWEEEVREDYDDGEEEEDEGDHHHMDYEDD